MNCNAIQRLMYEAVDRVLTPDERSAMDLHLPGCERCRTEQAVLESLIETVETAPEEQPSDDFTRIVMDRLPAPGRSSWSLPSLVFPRLVFALTLAAAALVWLYRAPAMAYLGQYVSFQEVREPLSIAIRDLQAYLQSTAGAAASLLPEPVSSSIDWGSLLVVVATLVVGYALVRAAEAFEIEDTRLQAGKRS